MKNEKGFKVGDIVIQRDRGRELWMVIGVQWVVDSRRPQRPVREIEIMDCTTNQVKTALAKYYCIFLA